MNLILFFLICTISLFGNVAVTENDPHSLVQGIVSTITGNLYALEEDVIIQGAEPLRLKRSYISGEKEGYWKFFEHLSAMIPPEKDAIIIPEANGTKLIYEKRKYNRHKYRLNLDKCSRGLTNTAKHILSAQTNLKNQYVLKKDDELHLIVPNGTIRIYKKLKREKIGERFPGSREPLGYERRFLLTREELPNGNKKNT